MKKNQNVVTKSAFTPFFFCINKDNKKKKKLIKDKVQIENADMRIIK